ncbi:hypothetical protein [Iodobacter ciconiae]|uniref:Uncharacterized protein n=1 Tax=Iodobacter ciconiae TaxID=2496266 RepID=A0A3S8ZVX5_9NEIS|nr:hypothetical protein [Iodobacter ciconiae]AZN37616.1 hypothetical protein EJO50_14745 [Iodobacter ciconiae]
MKQPLMIITALLLSHSCFAAPFCPWPVPGNETKRFINLTVVQTIDIGNEELRIAFGGGNLGSGHEIKLAIKSHAEGLKTLQEMTETARRCDQHN